jgi:hypothetical protein
MALLRLERAVPHFIALSDAAPCMQATNWCVDLRHAAPQACIRMAKELIAWMCKAEQAGPVLAAAPALCDGLRHFVGAALVLAKAAFCSKE